MQAARELERVILREGPDTVGSVILEPITAGGGVITPPEGYFETIQEICTRYGVLIHIDEVVCGMDVPASGSGTSIMVSSLTL